MRSMRKPSTSEGPRRTIACASWRRSFAIRCRVASLSSLAMLRLTRATIASIARRLLGPCRALSRGGRRARGPLSSTRPIATAASPWRRSKATVTDGVIPSLDGLRAISISIVLVSHAGYGSVVPGGLGVTIFFFLSGYLITTLLMDERERSGRIDIGKFYLRRAFRLFPPLLVSLVIAYSLVILGLLDGRISWAGVLAQLLYFANYYSLFFDPGNTTAAGTGILWSPAVALRRPGSRIRPALGPATVSVPLREKAAWIRVRAASRRPWSSRFVPSSRECQASPSGSIRRSPRP